MTVGAGGISTSTSTGPAKRHATGRPAAATGPRTDLRRRTRRPGPGPAPGAFDAADEAGPGPPTRSARTFSSRCTSATNSTTAASPGSTRTWEWQPDLLRLRAALEGRFLGALRDAVPGGADVAGELYRPSGDRPAARCSRRVLLARPRASDQRADRRARRELLSLHEILVEDLEHFGQRPKLDDYEQCLHIVFYGVEDDELDRSPPDRPRRDARHAPPRRLLLADGRAQADRGTRSGDEEHAVYRVIDVAHRLVLPAARSSSTTRSTASRMRSAAAGRDFDIEAVVTVRRRLADLAAVGPMRDMLAGAGDFMDRVPGLRSDETHDYYRDVYDHLLRIGDSLDSFAKC